MENILQSQQVVKQFVGHKALDNVNIDVPKGSIFGLLGPNGAGKTTLIRIINQITAPDSGCILLKGRLLKPDDVYHIGYLPEERGLYKKMKVGEQAMYLAQLKGLSTGEAKRRLKHWFTKLEIMPWWGKKVEELSKGMAQKVQFAITVLHEPELLIFDEPFSGFDPLNADMLKKEILELREKGSTIIFSTHNMASVEELCDHIALIHRGQCVLRGSLDEVRSSQNPQYEIRYAGNPDQLSAILAPDFTVVNKLLDNGLNSATVGITSNKTSNELLQTALSVVNVDYFSLIRPSMNDIFIEAVKEI
jgi:ABC-2 type transport system ATP-binding protein